MTSEGENNIKTANGNHEEYEDDPDFIQEAEEDLEQDLALEAQDSFDQENGGYPGYLYEQEQRSGGKIENTLWLTESFFNIFFFETLRKAMIFVV